MSELFDMDGLAGRLCAYPGITGFRAEAATLLTELFHRDKIARGDLQVIVGLRERTASPSGGCAVLQRFLVEKRDVLFPPLFAGT